MPDQQSHTGVLIVGGGYAGLASAVFLSAHGVPCILADRHPAVSVQGRARGINQRTMELYRPLAGDSAHVWPPAGAMGANSAVQDANNLAWKLGAVRAGLAGDALLDTYEAERRPVALALADITVRRQAARFGAGNEQGLDDDIDDLVLTLGQRYRSAAILGEVPSAPFGRPVADQPEPGARMPHAWLVRDGARISSHDLFTGGFVLLAGPRGEAWLEAADEARAASGVRLDAYQAGRGLADPDGAWPRFALPAGAAVLARPDGYVAWIGEEAAGPALTRALRRLLQAP